MFPSLCIVYVLYSDSCHRVVIHGRIELRRFFVLIYFMFVGLELMFAACEYMYVAHEHKFADCEHNFYRRKKKYLLRQKNIKNSKKESDFGRLTPSL